MRRCRGRCRAAGRTAGRPQASSATEISSRSSGARSDSGTSAARPSLKSAAQHWARLPPCVLSLDRVAGRADLHRVGAARVEVAPGRRLDQVGWGAVDVVEPGGPQRDRRAQELAGVGVPGSGEDLPRVADLDDLAGVHHRHPVASLGDDAQVVGDQQQGGAVVGAQVVEDPDDLRLDQDVERGGGLVGDHERRTQHQRQGDHQPLPHAAGELVRVGVVARGRDAHHPQRLQRPSLDLGLADRLVVRLQGLGEVLADPHQRVQPGQRLLEDHAQVAPAHGVLLLRLELEHVDAAEPELPVARAALGQQPDQAAAERGLAAAGLADQSEDLALPDVEAHAVDRAHRAALGAVPDAQVARLQHRLPRDPRPARPAPRRCRSSGGLPLARGLCR